MVCYYKKIPFTKPRALSGHAHPFTDPIITPLIKKRWMKG